VEPLRWRETPWCPAIAVLFQQCQCIHHGTVDIVVASEGQHLQQGGHNAAIVMTVGSARHPLYPVLVVFGRLGLVNLLLDDDPPQMHIIHAKRGADRYVPILPTLADEIRTHLKGRQTGFLFESNRQTRYSTRTVQSIVTNCARTAGIKKRVYPHLLRHSIATILLDSGLVPIDQVQKFLGHLNLSTTQIYAETSLRALGENYLRALGGKTVADGHAFDALVGRNFGLRLYVVQKKAWNENRKYRGSGGVAGAFEERKFS
jgi:hypothetical protein